MAKTGIFFMDAFSLAIIFLPLLPVVVIFLKKGLQDQALIFVSFLCLLNFIKEFLLAFTNLPLAAQCSIHQLFSIVEILLFFIIFWPAFPIKIKTPFSIFLAILLSSILTFLIMNSWSQQTSLPEVIETGVVLLIVLTGSVTLPKKEALQIFNSPLVWIAIGSIFYFSILFLLQLLNLSLSEKPNPDTKLILDLSGVARYFFYLLAGINYRKIAGEGIRNSGN